MALVCFDCFYYHAVGDRAERAMPPWVCKDGVKTAAGARGRPWWSHDASPEGVESGVGGGHKAGRDAAFIICTTRVPEGSVSAAP